MKGNRSRADAAAYPAACSICCRRRRSGSGFRQSCTAGRANLTRNLRDGPCRRGMLPWPIAWASGRPVRSALGPGSSGDSVFGAVTPSDGCRPRERARSRRYGRVTLPPVYRRSPHRTGLFVRSGQAEIRAQLLCSSAASYKAAGAEWSGDQRDSVPRPPRRAAHRRPGPGQRQRHSPRCTSFPISASVPARPANALSRVAPARLTRAFSGPVTVLPGG